MLTRLLALVFLLPLVACQQPPVATSESPRMHGMFAYQADAATFNECLSGRRFPVLMEKDYLALERAYREANPGAGSYVLAEIQGRLVQRAAQPGAATREYVLVERFGRLSPGETCARYAKSQASLTNTYWRPVELEGKPVVVAAGAREPHFILDKAGSRVRGYTGCNTLGGGFEQDASGFRFGKLFSTRMACVPASDLEQRFLSALEATASLRIVGEALDLIDRDGRVRGRFESVYLR
jgi:copper homeostasis protein (lipoprotein)